MKNRYPKDEQTKQKSSGSSIKTKKKNMKRMGGGGLSLQAFANAKSNNGYFNPALIKKQKEFYKNSKFVNKYKKSVKQQQSNPPLAIRPLEEENEIAFGRKEQNEADNGSKLEKEAEYGRKKENETEDGSKTNKNKRKKRYGARNLVDVYAKKHEELEKQRMEREAIIQAKKEAREKAEARRKSVKEMMLKKTHKGQPLMKYRIQHILETLQGSAKNA